MGSLHSSTNPQANGSSSTCSRTGPSPELAAAPELATAVEKPGDKSYAIRDCACHPRKRIRSARTCSQAYHDSHEIQAPHLKILRASLRELETSFTAFAHDRCRLRTQLRTYCVNTSSRISFRRTQAGAAAPGCPYGKSGLGVSFFKSLRYFRPDRSRHQGRWLLGQSGYSICQPTEFGVLGAWCTSGSKNSPATIQLNPTARLRNNCEEV